MSQSHDLILRHVRPFGGPQVDIGIRDGMISDIEQRLPGTGPEYDGHGRDLIPGIHDHHIHLFATAARMASVDLADCVDETEVATRLRAASAQGDLSSWLRATGFSEMGERLPNRHDLDRWINDRPLRIQDRTGALWILNSAAIDMLGSAPYPDCVETGARGIPTGRIWRGDAWLRSIAPAPLPSLRSLSLSLAAEGITAVTDAGAANGPEEAGLFEAAIDSKELIQRLTVMGTEGLPTSMRFRRGALKLLYDERDPADPADIAVRIRNARAQGRPVAAHCVTVAELLIYLEALDTAGGARPGDRVEHGGVIPAAIIPTLSERGLIVVTQPDFIRSRGDRYIATVPADEQPDLYRLRSLVEAGVEVRAGSDAPYGGYNPWQAMVSARTRKTAGGQTIALAESLDTGDTEKLFGLHCPSAIQVGVAADLCLLAAPLTEIVGITSNSPVDATFIAGTMTFER